MRRARYQEGCITRAPRKSGDVWEYRFRDHNRKQRTIVIGSVSKFKTERDARRQVESIRININAGSPMIGPAMTFRQLADHYCLKEMPMDEHESKAFSTKDTNYGYLRNWILPKWGDMRVANIKATPVEDWLKTLWILDEEGKPEKEMADGSKAKIRNLMSAIFRHGMRHEFIEKNPISLVRQGSKRQAIPDVLTVDEIQRLLPLLRQRERSMILLDAASGLRRSELFGLKWVDIDWLNKQVYVRRSIVKQVVGKLKTEASERPMPLDDYMLNDLRLWYSEAKYKEPEHFVWATDANRAGDKRGKQPCWPNKVFDRWIRPKLKEAEIEKRVNWHTFRHTFSTLLKANGEDVKVAQELLRHSSYKVTMDVYTQAVDAKKRDAQSRVVRAIVTAPTV